MSERKGGFLDAIEWLGNKLPEPAILFLFGAALVMAISHAGHLAKWEVQPVRLAVEQAPVLDAAGTPVVDAATGKPQMQPVVDPATGRPKLELRPEGAPIRTLSLLTPDGLYWCISKLVSNFINFPPLGIVLTGMLAVGVAERSGLIAALLKLAGIIVPTRFLTPMFLFLGINSSLASDAGYIVLPPLAAAMFLSVGRSPLAGIATAFAGIAAGFGASIGISAGDALIAGLTTAGAQVLDKNYLVLATCNWWFGIAATFLMTLVGWGVTSWFVEPRLSGRPAADGGPDPNRRLDPSAQRMTDTERRGLAWAGVVLLLVTIAVVTTIVIPGAPLFGKAPDVANNPPDRWVGAIIPIIFAVFMLPGIAYGLVVGTIRGQKDFARVMTESMAQMAPILVLSFFAAQFIAFFNHSNLGKQLAISGGTTLAAANVGSGVLMTLFVFLTAGFNLLIGSMSAKWTLFAPIFVPMFMIVGISPELTQAAYRVGDSVTNVITPLNSYLIIILALIQQYMPRAGMGTLISMMLPYTIVFTIVWTAMLLIWMQTGLPLGLGGPLHYVPTAP